MQTSRGTRPLGITIIAILNIISGIVMIFAGFGLAAASSLMPTISTIDPNAAGQMAIASLAGGAATAIGAVLIILGIVSFIVAWGLLKAKGWAWIVTIILSIISLVIGVISLVGGNVGSIVNIVIAGVIIYYMYRPHVKAYFGRTHIAP
jgi:hypothetical protein